jgi:ribosomal protein S18 acetylase RimI-like enzyme
VSRPQEFAQGASREPAYDSLRLLEPTAFTPDHFGIIAKQGNEWRGDFTWHKSTGVIQTVHVNPEHRRKGIATAMLQEAQRQAALHNHIPAPVHSSQLSDDGKAWKDSLG